MFNSEITYTGSYSTVIDCPKTDLPEISFTGRSNVGKSSLINALTNRKNIAYTSSNPGKTQSINFFEVNNSFIMVDLPGYGYAGVSKKMRADWKKMVYSFLNERSQMICCFSLLDFKTGLQKADWQFLKWVGENKIPVAFICTKYDKIPVTKRDKQKEKIREDLLEIFYNIPEIFFTSSKTGDGILDLQNYITSLIRNC